MKRINFLRAIWLILLLLFIEVFCGALLTLFFVDGSMVADVTKLRWSMGLLGVLSLVMSFVVFSYFPKYPKS